MAFKEYKGLSVDIEGNRVWLFEFSLGNDIIDGVSNDYMETIFPEEYDEYIENSDKWLSLQKFIEKWCEDNHRCEEEGDRVYSRIRDTLFLDPTELFYVYIGDQNET